MISCDRVEDQIGRSLNAMEYGTNVPIRGSVHICDGSRSL